MTFLQKLAPSDLGVSKVYNFSIKALLIRVILDLLNKRLYSQIIFIN